MLVLRGRLGLLIFDDAGKVVQVQELSAGGSAMGVDIPHGCWHSLLALEAGSVFFEAKAGPYTALTNAERASWAPLEGDARVAAYLQELRACFS